MTRQEFKHLTLYSLRRVDEFPEGGYGLQFRMVLNAYINKSLHYSALPLYNLHPNSQLISYFYWNPRNA